MSLTATKLTDAANTMSADNGEPLASCQIEYPTASPFNCDNSLLLVLEVSYFCLYDVASKRRLQPLLPVNASSEPRWHLTDPHKFYYHRDHILLEYNVATKLDRVVHTFHEYESISAKGESELGEDGDSLVLMGTGIVPHPEVFVFHIEALAAGPRLAIDFIDAVGLTPDGRVLIGKDDGIYLHDANLKYIRRLTKANGHRHTVRDLNGKPYLIWDNSADPNPRTFNEHAIVKIDLESGEQTKLMDFGWEFASHISAPMGNLGWCIVSTYDNATAGDLWRAWLDGRPAEHLIAHGSDSSTYEGQPHATVSRDGRWMAYNRNVAGKTDAYLVQLEQTQPEPTSLVWKRFPNQLAISIDGFPAQPGEAGFLYDGGDDVKILFNDGQHKWFIPMKQVK